MIQSTILITGANRGIGLELVRQYLHDGWQVIACCRSPEKAGDLSRLALRARGNLHILPLDVRDDSAFARLSLSLSGEGIDILFNNAGVYGPLSQGELSCVNTDKQSWQDTFLVNTIAPLQLVEALKPNLLLGEKKLVVLMSSRMGSLSDNSSGGAYIYRSSKAALNAVGKSLAVDLAEEGIGVALMHPGWVQTDMGGADALISATESVSGIKSVLENFSLNDSGQFLNYNGAIIPW